MLGEFDIIKKYFSHIGAPTQEILLGVGDDAAMLLPSPGEVLVVTTDTLLPDVHFYKNDSAESVAHKALAVNLSDLNAMGARPFGFLLALSLPNFDAQWVEKFSQRLHHEAVKAKVTLIGGDMTAGPLAISVTAFGSINPACALKRSAAKVGDDIYVTGILGMASLYVHAQQNNWPVSEVSKQAYHYPHPPLTFGPALCGHAHAAIDVSDGFFADLSHILSASGVGAHIFKNTVPVYKEWWDLAEKNILSTEEAFQYATTSGDDYQLCFTASPEKRQLLEELAATHHILLSRVGEIVTGTAILLDGHELPFIKKGWEHWSVMCEKKSII